MGFERVARTSAKLRMALTGVSGAGKTLGALYIAYGITGDWGKIAMIDTEHERGRLYADRSDSLPTPTGAFLYQALSAPFSPQRYKALVAEGASAVGDGGVVIIDSLSHAWMGAGGILEIKDRIAERPGKNSYTAWNEAGREQSDLVNSILAVGCHTIVTLRSKMEYVLEADERGKQKPVKLGLAPVQRDDTEYEFDIVLDIARSHVATASKDVTFLDQYGAVITPALGQQIRAWLDGGVIAKAPVCAHCGGEIKSTTKKTAEEIQAGTTAIVGEPMCLHCFAEHLQARKDTVTDLMRTAGIDDLGLLLETLKRRGEIVHDALTSMTEAEFNALCASLCA